MIFEDGHAAEAEAAGLLRSRGYAADPIGQDAYPAALKTALAGTHSLMRWVPDLVVAVPGTRRVFLVDVKSRPDGAGPDMSVELAPLMLALSGVLGLATAFMHGDRWAFASRVHGAIVPPSAPSTGCCAVHYRQAVCVSPDDWHTCLAVIHGLPEYCDGARRGPGSSGNPYVWVDRSCLVPVPVAVTVA